MHEYELLPDGNIQRNQAILLAIKILYAIEVGNAFECAVQPVSPAMIRTLQARSSAAGLGHHRGGVMTTNIEESAQLTILPSNHQYRFAGHFSRDVLPGCGNLFGTADDLPCPAEHGLAFEFCDALVGVPRSRDRRGLGQRLRGIKL